MNYFIEISADASYAPRGDRSRTGVVIKVLGVIVHWCSNKQSITSVSSCESELSSAVTGIKLGLGIRQVVEEMLETCVPMNLNQDNMACIQTLLNEITSWRSRHYALRAAWVRDMIHQEQIVVSHERGVLITADGLTKILQKIKLAEMRERMGFIKH